MFAAEFGFILHLRLLWITSLTRCKTVTPLSAGSKKAEDCSKRGTSRRKSCKTYSCQSKRRPAFVCWKQRKRLLTLVIRLSEPRKFKSIFRAQDISRCSWVYHTLMRTKLLVRVRMLYTRGFLHVYSTIWVFLRPQNTDNISYPRFFICLFTIFFQYETQNPPFFSGRLIDRPKCTSLRFPIRRPVLQHNERHHRGTTLDSLQVLHLCYRIQILMW